MATVYEIATRISLENKVSGVLAVLSRDILNVEGGLKKLQREFDSLGKGAIALGGALAAAFGVTIISGMKKLADHAKELSNETAKMKNLGMSPADFERMKGAAYSSNVPGATTSDAMKILNTTFSLFGPATAIKMLKPLLEFEQLLGATSGDYKGAENKVLSMVRAGELMGKFVNQVTHEVDINKLQHFLDLGSKVQQATHGRVSAQAWLALAQQGGAAISGMSDEGLLTMAMVTQAMGGHRAGTAMASLFTQFKGGIMTVWRARQLQDFGLLKKDAIEDVTPGGHITWKKGSEPGTTPFAKMLGTDPMAAVAMFSAAMSAHGIKDPEEQVRTIFQIGQRQTSVRLIHDIFRNMPQMGPERERILGAAGTGQALKTLNAESYARNLELLDAAWRKLLENVGGPIAQAAIPVLQRLTSILDSFTVWAQQNGPTIQLASKWITALGVALTVLGGVAVVGALAAMAGPTGLLASFAAGLLALNVAFTDIKASLEDLKQGFFKLWDTIKELVHNITHLGGLIPGAYGGGGIGGGGLIKTSLGGGGGGGSLSPGRVPPVHGDVGAAMTAAEAQLRAEGVPEEHVHAAAAALIGNAMHESGLNPGAIHDSGTGYGIYGARLGRRYKMLAWLSAHGFARNSLEGQARYMAHEAHGYGPTWRALMGATGGNLAGTAVTVEKNFESPRPGSSGSRIAGAFSAFRRGVHPNHGRIGTVRPYHAGHGGGDVEAHVYLDGRMMAQNTVGHIMKSSALQSQAAHYDGSGFYNGPAAQLNTA